jgi:hypothetical protein
VVSTGDCSDRWYNEKQLRTSAQMPSCTRTAQLRGRCVLRAPAMLLQWVVRAAGFTSCLPQHLPLALLCTGIKCTSSTTSRADVNGGACGRRGCCWQRRAPVPSPFRRPPTACAWRSVGAYLRASRGGGGEGQGTFCSCLTRSLTGPHAQRTSCAT